MAVLLSAAAGLVVADPCACIPCDRNDPQGGNGEAIAV